MSTIKLFLIILPFFSCLLTHCETLPVEGSCPVSVKVPTTESNNLHYSDSFVYCAHTECDESDAPTTADCDQNYEDLQRFNNGEGSFIQNYPVQATGYIDTTDDDPTPEWSHTTSAERLDQISRNPDFVPVNGFRRCVATRSLGPGIVNEGEPLDWRNEWTIGIRYLFDYQTEVDRAVDGDCVNPDITCESGKGCKVCLDNIGCQGCFRVEGSPVYLDRGEFFYRSRDLQLSTQGVPLYIQREYQSQSQATSIFGVGWSFNHEGYISETETNGAQGRTVYVIIGDHKRIYWDPYPGDDRTEPITDDRVKLKNVSGSSEYLIYDIATERYTLQKPDGSETWYFDRFNRLERYQTETNAINYSYEDKPDNEKHLARLILLTADHGNQYISIQYNPNSVTITDGQNKAWTYYLDGYKLTSVTGPAETDNTQRFIQFYHHTDTNHPDKVTRISTANEDIHNITYNSDGKVSYFTDHGKSYDLIYDGNQVIEARRIDNSLDHDRIAGTTVNQSGLVTSTFIGSEDIARLVYDDLNRVERVDNAAGLVTAFKYDTYGNLVKRTIIPTSSFKEHYATTAQQWNASKLVADPHYEVFREAKDCKQILHPTSGNFTNSPSILDRYGLDEDEVSTSNVVVRCAVPPQSLTNEELGTVSSQEPMTTNFTTRVYIYSANQYPFSQTCSSQQGKDFLTGDDLFPFVYKRYASPRAHPKPFYQAVDASGCFYTNLADMPGISVEYEYTFISMANKHVISKVIDPQGNEIDFSYIESGANLGRLDTMTLPTGEVLKYTYNSNGLVAGTRFQNQANSLRSYEYDAANRLIESCKSNDVCMNIHYDSLTGDLDYLLDFDGNKIDFTFDNHGRVTTVDYPSFNQGDATITRQDTYKYNSNNQLIEIGDSDGNLTVFHVDQHGKPEQIDYPHNASVSFDYDGKYLEYYTDERGVRTKYERDQWGFTSTVIRDFDNLKITTQKDFDKTGRLLQLTDPDNRVFIPTYDEFSRLTALYMPSGASFEYEYNQNSELINFRDPDKQIDFKQIFQNGRLSKTSLTDGVSELENIYQYNTETGLLENAIDAEGKVTTYGYNENFELDNIQLPANQSGVRLSTSFIYNNNGQIENYTKTDSKIWEYQFNADGSVKAEGNPDRPDNQTLSYKYYQNGNLERVTWPSQKCKEFTYNEIYQPKSIKYSDDCSVSEPAYNAEITIKYWPNGLVKSVSDGTNLVSRYYDNLNRLSEVHYPFLDRKVKYGYTNSSTLNKKEIVRDSDNATLYLEELDFDLVENSISIDVFDSTNFSSGHVYIKLLPSGRIDFIQMPAGNGSSSNIEKDYEYDQFGRLSKLTYRRDHQVIYEKRILEYLNTGQQKKVEVFANNTLDTFEYRYDNLDRLVYVFKNDELEPHEEYQYTATGGFSYVKQGNVTKDFIYQPDYFDRIDIVVVTEDSTPTQWKFIYDADGNLVERRNLDDSSKSVFYRYNSLNQLYEVEIDGAIQETNYYPESDLRLSTVAVNGDTSSFLYDGPNELETRTSISGTDPIQYDVEYSVNVPGVYDHRLLQFDPDSTSNRIEPVIATESHSVVSDKFDEVSNDLENTFNYYAYGNLELGDTPASGDKGYTGRPQDSFSDLRYHRGRYVDGCSGTFTQVDPAQFGQNWYAYGNGLGDPVNMVDPSGNVPVLLIYFVGGGAAGALFEEGAHYVFGTGEDNRGFWDRTKSFFINGIATVTGAKAIQIAGKTIQGARTLFAIEGAASEATAALLEGITSRCNSSGILEAGLSGAVNSVVMGKIAKYIPGKVASNIAPKKPEWVYRGSSSDANSKFDLGFEARGTSTNLRLHAIDNQKPPSAFVSTSKDPYIATEFATGGFYDPGNVYVIRKPKSGIDVNLSLGAASPNPRELEIAVPWKIEPSDIRGVTPVNADGSYVGYSILNPNYRP